MRFYLGTHKPVWLGREAFTDIPLFVSHRVLAPRKTLPRAVGSWSLDSGGFSELSMYGEWRTTPKAYATAVRRYRDEVGRLEWASQQDWMCEPHMIAKTGLSVAEHQRRTIENYLTLRALAPDLPIVPVIQGWELADYLRCVDAYMAAGVNLREVPTIGVGSVCRRQATADIGVIFGRLHAEGLRGMHGFGVKAEGLRRYGRYLGSADSMAWSFGARYRPPLPTCTHARCNNCPIYARAWRASVLDATAAPSNAGRTHRTH